MLDCALIDVATIEPLVPLGDLIERLGELEAPARRQGRGARGRRPVDPAAASPPRPDPGARGGGAEALRAGHRRSSPEQGRVRSRRARTSAPDAVRRRPRGRTPRARAALRPGRSRTRSRPARCRCSRAARSRHRERGQRLGAPAAPRGTGAHAPERCLAGRPPPRRTLATPSNSAEALVGWAQVIDYLETQRKISLRGYCEFARVLSWTAHELELGFATDAESRWAGESLIEKQNVDELKAVLAELGQKLKVDVRLLDEAQSKAHPARSLVESTRANTSAERHKRESEAREHPITKHVLQTFGASIKEIKTDV